MYFMFLFMVSLSLQGYEIVLRIIEDFKVIDKMMSIFSQAGDGLVYIVRCRFIWASIFIYVVYHFSETFILNHLYGIWS